MKNATALRAAKARIRAREATRPTAEQKLQAEINDVGDRLGRTGGEALKANLTLNAIYELLKLHKRGEM